VPLPQEGLAQDVETAVALPPASAVGHSAILEAPEQCMALIAPFLSTGALP
jgi:hypothetical protein